MGQEPPRLTDRRALAARRARAARLAAPARFLHDTARTEIDERLAEVNRAFTAPAVVSGDPGAWRQWRGALVVPDEPLLALEPEAHDLVVHAMALHWADDPVGQLVQCRRALRPDGLMIAVLPGGETLTELRSCLAEAELAVRGGLSPRVAPMGEIRDLGALLQRAGFALPVADSLRLSVSYASPRALLHDLRAMGETNVLSLRERRGLRRDVLERAEALYAARHPDPEDGTPGRVTATLEIVTLTGWAPHASQPRPLRPGSAAARLADALGTEERPAGDTAGPSGD